MGIRKGIAQPEVIIFDGAQIEHNTRRLKAFGKSKKALPFGIGNIIVTMYHNVILLHFFRLVSTRFFYFA
jgi:nicotinic acid phosphoribosyltransferase